MAVEVSADRAAWVREALRRYEGPLLRYACSILGSPEAAGDIVQETFLELCSANPDKVDDHLAPWLFKVARNRALDVLRKERRMNPLDDKTLAEQAGKDPGPAEVYAQSQTKCRVLKAVEDLPKRQQEVVRLKFQEGLSYRQIGEVTGDTVSNVGFLIHTAVKTIRERLSDQSARA